MGKKTSSDVLTVSLNISLPFWGMRGRPSKFSKTCFLVENLGLHIWKHKSLVKSCWCMGGDGHRWWTCAKWESWIMLCHKMLDFNFCRIQLVLWMEENWFLTFACRTTGPAGGKTCNTERLILALGKLPIKRFRYLLCFCWEVNWFCILTG